MTHCERKLLKEVMHLNQSLRNKTVNEILCKIEMPKTCKQKNSCSSKVVAM